MAANPLIAGSYAAIPQGMDFTWDPRRGFVPGASEIGPVKVELARAYQYIAAQVAFSFKQNGPNATIKALGNQAVDPSGVEMPVDVWQLTGNELNKSYKEHPNSIALETAKTGTLATLLADLGIFTSVNAKPDASGNLIYPQSNDIGNAYGFQPFVYGTNNYALAMQLFRLLVKGTDHYAVAAPVLRHSQVAGDSYAGGGFNYANLEKIYSTQQLLAECALFPRPLPAAHIAAINSIVAPTLTGTDATDYIWGWRKVPPTISTVANYKVETVTEFVLDLWSSFYYSAAVTS